MPEKDYRIVKCKNCGKRNKFPTYCDEWQTDVICDECGQYLGEYE